MLLLKLINRGTLAYYYCKWIALIRWFGGRDGVITKVIGWSVVEGVGEGGLCFKIYTYKFILFIDLLAVDAK